MWSTCSMPTFEELLARWDGEQAVIRYDAASEAWILVCVHSTVLGPAAGGTRLNVYPTPGDGLFDAMRLSAGMTSKMAVAGIELGGGKAVLAVPEIPTGDARRRLLHAYAEVVDALRGTYLTGEDVNTTPADMDVIAERTRFVFGRSEQNGGSGNPGPYTALGVYHGLRASLAHVFGSDELAGRTVVVQGAGSVGSALAARLGQDGAAVLIADVDRGRADRAAAAAGGTTISPDAVATTECDVYAPCALGATLSAETIPRLRCRIVAGSANNQLAEPADADLLREAEIVYAPDYVVNAGGALAVVALEVQGGTEAEARDAVARIGPTLAEILARADRDGISTAAAADELAAARLAAARSR
jgi:leucine dehydrogenase